MNMHAAVIGREAVKTSAELLVAEAAVQRLTAAYPQQTLTERLAAIAQTIAGRVVFTTSFGIEDQAVAHAIFSQDLPIDVVTLDTGRLFPETYEVWTQTERRYGRRIRAFSPEQPAVEALVAGQGIDGFRNSVEARQACCGVRKVVPLGRALRGAAGWITGIRTEQSAGRAHLPYAAVDAGYGLVKVNPLLDWTRERLVTFVRDEFIPTNVLHDRGFLSIGCAPCTRALKPGEPERAGRWWWEQEDKKECGLHRYRGAAATATPEPATAGGEE
jgi:phosphoadenosine phosphosulfate reductase